MTLSIPDFSAVRVVVAGDVMLDQYWFGQTGRISPEAPVPVVRLDGDEGRPGGAANVATNLARLGVKTHLVGVVGRDAAAAELEALLREAGVTTGFQVDDELPTITKLRVLARNQQLIRLDREETPGTAGKSLAGVLGEALPADVVILSDYAKGALDDAGALIALCRELSVPVLVDPEGHGTSRATVAQRC